MPTDLDNAFVLAEDMRRRGKRYDDLNPAGQRLLRVLQGHLQTQGFSSYDDYLTRRSRSIPSQAQQPSLLRRAVGYLTEPVPLTIPKLGEPYSRAPGSIPIPISEQDIQVPRFVRAVPDLLKGIAEFRAMGVTPAAEAAIGTATAEAIRRSLPTVRTGIAAVRRGGQRITAMPEPRPAGIVPETQVGVTTPAVTPAQTAEQKVIQALRAAKPVRAEQEALYSAERSRRLGAVLEIGAREPTLAGTYKQLGALKGPLPKPQFTPLTIGEVERDALFQQIEASPLLRGYEKPGARIGFAKLFGDYGGQVPTETELKLLSRVFSQEFIKTVQAKRGLIPNIMATGMEALGVPKALMASTDMSAPLRQGAVALPSFPRQWGQSFLNMFRVFGDERAFQALKENIVSRSSYEKMREYGLALTGLDDAFITGREEQFASTLAERLPVFGRMVRASDRAYTGFLMKLRADAFDEMVRRAEQAGVEQTPQMLQSAAKFINAATGRGRFAEGGTLDRATGALSTLLFSPRYLASRFNLLNPLWYYRLDPFVRKQALKGSLAFAALGSTVLGLAKAGGAQVGEDPRSADFGKIKSGNTRWDIWSGLLQYPRITAQLITGKIVSSTTGKVYTLGEGYRPLTRKDIALRFFESKANPVLGFALDLLDQRDFSGQPLNIPQRVKDLFIPMVLQDLWDIYKDDPSLLPWATPAFFGVGVQTYAPRKPKVK